MVDELRERGEDRAGLVNRFSRDYESGLLFKTFDWPDVPLSEVKLTGNSFNLAPGDHPGGYFEKNNLFVAGVPGSRVVGKWSIDSSFAKISGVHFFADRGVVPLVELGPTARVLFVDCVFEMSPAADSTAVTIASGGKAFFSGCSFIPELSGGTGNPIDNSGLAANAVVIWGANFTGRAHNSVTVVTTEMTP
ncbi:MAG: hypothetical protein Unbinned400contig1002_22 [Prokaryotic dsDNA virus sp.]|nr:MAG: hypothetical protein Unbinned400contig1002_22 [Prokaryotic dsDNA virus sp.]